MNYGTITRITKYAAGVIIGEEVRYSETIKVNSFDDVLTATEQLKGKQAPSVDIETFKDTGKPRMVTASWTEAA